MLMERILFLSIKNKKIHNVLIIISMGFTYIFDLNIGNVFENITGLPVLLVFLIIIYL